ncbi:hypothetical protein AeRB84_014053 [Aphanomyces euteiches]|nr:hypothetical protein AeRB84_014053 [Aphanomyces euteiches]
MDTRVKKKRRREVAVESHFSKMPAIATLPVDVLLKIAFTIPDAEDLFAFLEALRVDIDLGPLEYLHQLGQTHEHTDLWPTLFLDSLLLDELSTSPCQAVVKYYPSVIVEDGWENIEWLKAHVNPMATVEWYVNGFPQTVKNVDDWAKLQITKASITIDSETTASTWKDVVPRLQHLTSLYVGDDFGQLDGIHALLPTSHQLTNFEIFATKMENADLMYLNQWFRSHPVQVFESWFTEWRELDYNLRQALCEAMFNCPTLERLRLTDCYLDDMDFTKFNFSMKSLLLDELDSESNVLIALASRLEGSKLTHLEISDYVDDNNTKGMECLLRALPQSSIKSLTFSGLHIKGAAWCKVARLFKNCGLETLTLGSDEISSDFAQSLATAIQKNRTISGLHLSKCQIAISDLQRSIQSIGYSTRRVKNRQIKWTSPISETVSETTIKALEEYATKCGCDFIHERALW